MIPLLVTLGIGAVVLLGAMAILVRGRHLTGANEVLVVTGTRPPRFRFGGHLQMPLVEIVDRLDLVPLELDLLLPGSEERAGGKLHARAQIERDLDALTKAARLLLDLSREERSRIVERVVRAAALGVLQRSGRAPDRERIASAISEEAQDQLSKLGLRLDAVRFEPSSV